MAAPSAPNAAGRLITISVKTLDSKVIQVQVDPSMTVQALKEKLAAQTNLPAAAQRLIFKGKVLKDDQTLASYSIEEGFALHLVERPPGAPGQQAPGAQQAAQPSAPPPAARQGPAGSQPPGMPTVMMGSITLPPGTAVADIIPSLLAQQGPAPAAQGPPPPAEVLEPFRLTLGQLETSLGATPLAPATPPTPAPAAPAGAPQLTVLAHQLRQLQRGVDALSPALGRLAAQLESESSLPDPAQRAPVQQLAAALAASLGHLGAAAAQAAPLLNSVRLGDAPGQQQILPIAARPRSSSASISVSVPLFTIHPRQNPAAPGGPDAAAPAGAGQQQQALLQFMNSVLGPGQRPAQPAAPAGPGPGPIPGAAPPAGDAAHAQGFNLGNLMQMVGPALQQLQAQVFQQIPAPPAPATATATSTPALAAAPLASHAAKPAASPMLSPRSAAGQAAQARAAPPPATKPAAAVSSPAAMMIAQMYTQLNQEMQRSGATAAPQSVASFLASMANVPPEQQAAEPSGDILSDMLEVALESLTVPDLLEVMQDNWAALDRLHPLLRQHLLAAATAPAGQRPPVPKGPPGAVATNAPTPVPSAQQLARLSEDMVASLRDAVAEEHLPADIKARILPGRELTACSLRVIRSYAEALLALILQPPAAPSSPDSFPLALRAWTAGFVLELVSTLAGALQGGVADAAVVVRYFIQERLSGMGDFAVMGSQLLTTYVMNTYNQAAARAASAPAAPAPALAEAAAPPAPPPPLPALDADPSSWAPLIAQDELLQQHLPPQPPLSPSYMAGAPGQGKKRKSRKAATPEAQLADRMQGAAARRSSRQRTATTPLAAPDAQEGDSSETPIERVVQEASATPVLVSLYRDMLVADLQQRAAAPQKR